MPDSEEASQGAAIMSLMENDLNQFNQLMAEDLTDTKVLKWKKSINSKKDKDYTLTMYQRPTGKGKMNLIRSDLVFKNKNIDKFTEISMNIECFKNSSHKELYLVEQIDENTHIWYSRAKLPLMTDRDLLLQVQKVPQDNGTYIVICKSIDRSDFPEKKGVIRMEMFKMSLLE